MNTKRLIGLIKRANYIYIIGNGGSASTANHFAQDLVKIGKKRAVSLCSNEALLTAISNDDGYENIFIDQLKVFLTCDDLVITLSGSGTSKNIVKAIEYVTQHPIFTYFSFPTMKQMQMTMQEIEDYHLKLAHKIVMEVAR